MQTYTQPGSYQQTSDLGSQATPLRSIGASESYPGPGTKSKRRPESGIGRWTFLFFGLVISAVVYSGYHIIPYYYNYFEIENQMRSLIRVASLHTDQELRKKFADHLKFMDIPATIDELRIERGNDYMRLELSYDEDFWVSFRGKDYHIHTFHFDARAEGAY